MLVGSAPVRVVVSAKISLLLSRRGDSGGRGGDRSDGARDQQRCLDQFRRPSDLVGDAWFPFHDSPATAFVCVRDPGRYTATRWATERLRKVAKRCMKSRYSISVRSSRL